MNNIIACKGISKQFSTKQVLHDVSFSCQEGSPIALIGPNGAGKTTLLSILCGYIKADSGTVEIFGEAAGSKALYGMLSALPQDAQFAADITIHAQLQFYAQLQGFSRKAAALEASRVLALFALTDAAELLPRHLSHGMAKRAAIAQALIGSPRLVLLDEPTAGLDPANAKILRQQILTLSSDVTFIISSHNVHELERMCQQVLFLDQGRLQQSVVSDFSKGSFVTLMLEGVAEELVQAALLTMPEVVAVIPQQGAMYTIEYNGAADFDCKLLQFLQHKSWSYRQLIKGKTLEDQLFS
jgi:ABC-2 type transport system ATP-binding protein